MYCIFRTYHYSENDYDNDCNYHKFVYLSHSWFIIINENGYNII